MNIKEEGVKPYNLTGTTNNKNLTVISKLVNRLYTCEISGGTIFHPYEFSLTPKTSGEKILWGGFENIDGTSQSANTLVNTEDYNRYSASSQMVDDTSIYVGNISGQVGTSKCRVPFYTNGYSDGKFVTNVSGATLTGNYSAITNGYVFAATNLISACSAWTIMFPNGYVVNCVSNGGTNRLSCYTLTDEYTLDIMQKSKNSGYSGRTNCQNYIRRASIFPSISYETYVAPFYSEMSMALIDNSLAIDITTGISLTDYNYRQNITVSGTSSSTNTRYTVYVGILGTANGSQIVINLIQVANATPSQLDCTGLSLTFLGQTINIQANGDTWGSVGGYTIDGYSSGDTWGDFVLKKSGESTGVTYTGLTNDRIGTNTFYHTLVFSSVQGKEIQTGITSGSTSSDTRNYGVWASINNQMGADKYEIKFNYDIYNGGTRESTTSTTLTLSGAVKSLFTPLSVPNRSIKNIVFSSYQINGGPQQTNLHPPKPSYRSLWAAYGKVNGGITSGNTHKLSMNGLVPGSIFNESITASTVVETIGNGSNPKVYSDSIGITEFNYEIEEGITKYTSAVSHFNISDSVSFSEFPTLTYDGTKIYAPGGSRCKFYIAQSGNSTNGITYFKLNDAGYPISSSTDYPRIGNTNSGWTSEMAGIGGGTQYTPRQDKFIVGVYEINDPNDVTPNGADGRVKTRLVKVYRNYEIEYIGT